MQKSRLLRLMSVGAVTGTAPSGMTSSEVDAVATASEATATRSAKTRIVAEGRGGREEERAKRAVWAWKVRRGRRAAEGVSRVGRPGSVEGRKGAGWERRVDGSAELRRSSCNPPGQAQRCGELVGERERWVRKKSRSSLASRLSLGGWEALVGRAARDGCLAQTAWTLDGA